jgi:hypothetical protein
MLWAISLMSEWMRSKAFNYHLVNKKKSNKIKISPLANILAGDVKTKFTIPIFSGINTKKDTQWSP